MFLHKSNYDENVMFFHKSIYDKNFTFFHKSTKSKYVPSGVYGADGEHAREGHGHAAVAVGGLVGLQALERANSHNEMQTPFDRSMVVPTSTNSQIIWTYSKPKIK